MPTNTIKSSVQVLGTDEIVDEESGIYSSGFSNEAITAQTESTTEKLALGGTLAQAAQETATAAAITAAISFSIGVAESLKNGRPLDDAARQALKPAQEATAVAVAPNSSQRSLQFSKHRPLCCGMTLLVNKMREDVRGLLIKHMRVSSYTILNVRFYIFVLLEAPA